MAQKRKHLGEIRYWMWIPMLAGGGLLLYRGLTGKWPGVKRREPGKLSARVEKSITVNRPKHEVYLFWRENPPLFFNRHAESGKIFDHRRSPESPDGKSPWTAKILRRMPMRLETEMTEEKENERLSWRSLPGANVEHFGQVFFREGVGDRGTEIKVCLEYRLGGGVTGPTRAGILKSLARHQIKEDLRAFKALLETGEIPTAGDRPSSQRPTRKEG